VSKQVDAGFPGDRQACPLRWAVDRLSVTNQSQSAEAVVASAG